VREAYEARTRRTPRDRHVWFANTDLCGARERRRLRLEDAAPQRYVAVAVMYNDGAHWWADMMASGHFKHQRGQDGLSRPNGSASYRCVFVPPANADAKRPCVHGCLLMRRVLSFDVPEISVSCHGRYDGLEASGKLRFVSSGSRGITLTSDRQHISLVLYRREPIVSTQLQRSQVAAVAKRGRDDTLNSRPGSSTNNASLLAGILRRPKAASTGVAVDPRLPSYQ
jgi:hypothetical protein